MGRASAVSLESIARMMVDAGEALGVGMVVVEASPRPRFLFASGGMTTITGYSVEELLELDPLALADPHEVPHLMEIARQHSRSAAVDPRLFDPRALHFETAIRRRDDRSVRVEAAISDLEQGDGRVSVVFVVDVTHQREVERKLRASEVRAQRLLDSAPDAIWVLDRDRIHYANSVCMAMFGYEADTDYTSFDPRQIIHPDDVALFEERAFAMLALGQSLPPCEYRVRRRDGRLMTIEVTSVVGEFEGRRAVFSFGRDVSGRRQAESRRLQADRLGALGLLAGGMAHAINNPLTYVLLNLDHVAQRLPRIPEDATQQSEVLVRLTEARDGAERVASVVRQMRAMSRTDDHEQGQINLHDVVKSAAGMVGHEIRHRGTLHLELAEVPPVFGNAARLEQVFINLLVFVARSLPEGGQVLLRLTSYDRAQATVELSFDGVTIDHKLLQQALEPLPGYDTDPEQPAPGLSLCNGIVRGLGGTMQIESLPRGGTVFRVCLPLDTREVTLPPPRPAMESEPPPAPSGRARVLVVDDDAGVIEALRVMLEDEHDVTCMTSGREALRLLLRGERFDVVFCDLMMPEVSGMDLFEALRLNRPGQESSLVFMTGGAFTREADRFLARVPNPHIDKPFDMRSLSRILRRMVAVAES